MRQPQLLLMKWINSLESMITLTEEYLVYKSVDKTEDDISLMKMKITTKSNIDVAEFVFKIADDEAMILISDELNDYQDAVRPINLETLLANTSRMLYYWNNILSKGIK